MKRLGLILATLGILSGLVFAQVSSVNVVGYNKVTVPPSGKMTLVSMQFDPFDATLNGVLGTNVLQATLPVKNGTGHQVYLWNTKSSTYGICRLSTNGWWYDVTNPGVPTNPAIVAGSGFWLRSPPTATSNMDVAIMGQVVDVMTQQLSVVSNLQIVAYPFSCDIGLNQTALTAAKGVAGTTGLKGGNGDQIYTWDSGLQSYNIFRLSTNPAVGWYNITNAGVSTTNVLSLGQAMWYTAKFGGFSWTETNMYLNNLRN